MIWTKIWKLANIKNQDEPINSSILSDPKNPLVVFILYAYSLETFLYSVLNRALMENDSKKIKTLGPFAKVLGKILQSSSAF